MLRYTAVRTVWILVILVTILSMNFVILQSAPEYPPPTPDDRDMYYDRQVADGYFTVRVERDEEIVRAINESDDSVYVRSERNYYQRNPRTGPVEFYRIYEPVPIATQYVRWVGNIVTEWNWGYSTRVAPNVPVFEVLMSRIPITMQLNLLALFFYIPIGFALGIVAALRKDGVVDNLVTLFVMIFISIPSFVVMLFLVLIFGYQLEWLPTQFPTADAVGMVRFTGLILPVLGLAFQPIASLTRVTRAELTEVLTSEFLLLARTKGLTRPQSIVRHAMRNSMVPLVPGIIFSFVGLLSGSVIIETIYGIPGTGRVFIRAMALNNYDYNLILGTTAFYTIIGLFAVLLVDLSYGIVDPRIRMGAKK